MEMGWNLSTLASSQTILPHQPAAALVHDPVGSDIVLAIFRLKSSAPHESSMIPQEITNNGTVPGREKEKRNPSDANQDPRLRVNAYPAKIPTIMLVNKATR